jgi:DNA polymerase III psi subunit
MTIEPEALYSMFDTLFLPNEKEVQTRKQETKPTSKCRVLMVFEKEYDAEESEFLNKILAASKIKPEEVETKFEVTSEQLPEYFENGSSYLLIWGMDYPQLESYKFTKKGTTNVLMIDSLSTLKNNQSLKGKLWNCLKEEFVN